MQNNYVGEIEFTTSLAYKLLPSLSSNFVKLPLSCNPSVDDTLPNAFEAEVGPKTIEANRDENIVFCRSVSC